MTSISIEERARRFAALGDPVRLRIVEHLDRSDRSPNELRAWLDIDSNLLAHHLTVLEKAGLVVRGKSSGDGRRTYVHLTPLARHTMPTTRAPLDEPVLFVCTANSARSQLAAALWVDIVDRDARSAGTHPASAVHPEASAAAARAGLDLTDARPTALTDIGTVPPLVITVCDRVHEEIGSANRWLHWSIPDPAPDGSSRTFDLTVAELRTWIEAVSVA